MVSAHFHKLSFRTASVSCISSPKRSVTEICPERGERKGGMSSAHCEEAINLETNQVISQMQPELFQDLFCYLHVIEVNVGV